MADFPTSGDDVIFGTSAGEEIDALAGNDTVFGAGGNDTLIGNGGNDELSGGAGRDLLKGGKGSDTAYYAFAFGGVVASLTDGSGYLVSAGAKSDLDRYESIENLMGGLGGDELEGNGFRNTLTGNGGEDVLFGLGGADVLEGGADQDSLFGGDGNDTIDGGSGDDYIVDDNGADTIDGGVGFDQIQFSFTAEGVNVNLATGVGSGGTAEGDTYTRVEAILGSAFDDTLRGDGKENHLSGNNGADTLIGRGGNDNLGGIGGNDVLKGGGGNDLIGGGLGQDDMTGGAGNDTFIYASTAESVPFMPEADVIADFTPGEDHIAVYLIDAKPLTAGDDAFIFRGTQQYLEGVAGQIRVNFSGGITVVSFRTDLSGTDMFIVLDGSIDLTADDFVL